MFRIPERNTQPAAAYKLFCPPQSYDWVRAFFLAIGYLPQRKIKMKAMYDKEKFLVISDNVAKWKENYPNLFLSPQAETGISSLFSFFAGLEFGGKSKASKTLHEDFTLSLERLCRSKGNYRGEVPLPGNDEVKVKVHTHRVVMFTDSMFDYSWEFLKVDRILPDSESKYDSSTQAAYVDRVFAEGQYWNVIYKPYLFGGLICSYNYLEDALGGKRVNYIWSSHS